MARKNASRQRGRIWNVIVFVSIGLALIAGGLVVSFVLSAVNDLPALANLEPQTSERSVVYDREGRVWTELHSTEYRIPISLEELPRHFVDAVLAAEDHRFYSHKGVDVKAILRAAWTNLTDSGDSLQGGSTITQQLAKMAFLEQDRVWKRKVQDAVVALLLERKYTKDEILEMYLNQAPFGRGAYGPEAAAKAFFGKPAKDLTIEESAMIAGMLRGPYLYDPATNPEGALTRRNTVIDQMAAYGFITTAEAEACKEKPINAVTAKSSVVSEGGYFLDYVLKQLLSRYSADQVYGGGLQIYTTYSPETQRTAENAISKALDKDFPYQDENSIQAASVVMDVKTGHVLAIVGGRKHEGMLSWNRAIDAKRQPGSSFKPLAVYVPAIEAGMGPSTVIDDSPITWQDPATGEKFSPRNYSGTFQGPVSMRKAVRESLNVVAAKVQDMVGIDRSFESAVRLGVTSLVGTHTPDGRYDRTRSLALGGLTYGVSPMDMAVAYATIANRGIRTEPITIVKVEDKYGNVLEMHETKRTLAISEETAYIMTSMLQDVITVPGGTGGAANIGSPAAGKTGTTDDWKDAWFCGFTPTKVGVVWMGFDQERTMEQWRITGGSYPALIWQYMMSDIMSKEGPSNFTKPSGVVTETICASSGLKPSPYCPADTITEEIFAEVHVPSTTCTVHVEE
jgi:penicillin-binding protein 1A